MENDLKEIRDKILLPSANYNAVDAFVDMMGIFDSFRKETEGATMEEKKKFFKFFLYGIVFTIASIYIMLLGLGITIPPEKWAICIAGTFVSLGFAYVWGKNRDVIMQVINSDPKNLLENIRVAAMKLTNLGKKE